MTYTQLAIVLRAKGGNFMIQTNGIPGKFVQDAATDALAILSRHATGEAAAPERLAQPQLDSSGDAPPNLALGQISVLQGRYIATYRMVHSILVLLISQPESTNTFEFLRILDACGKILVGACKGVDVTPERLSKRYGDVHSFLGALIAGGLAALPPAFIHASATDQKLLGVPLSVADAARRIKQMVGSGGKQSAFGTSKQSGSTDQNDTAPVALPETPTKKESRQQSGRKADPLRLIEFQIPNDALPPPPARALGAKRRPPAPPIVATMRAPTVFQGALDEEAENKPPEEAEGFGAFGPVELLEAEKEQASAAAEEDWEAGFEGETKEEGGIDSRISIIEDLKESLQLVEIYKAEVTSGQLTSALIEGAVRRRLAPFGLESAKFRIVPSPTLVVNACLQTAARNVVHASEPDDSFGFSARLIGAPMDCSYLKYSLPPVACLPPLQVDLLVAPPNNMNKSSTGVQWQALIVLRCASNPDLSGPLLDVVVEVDLPPELSVLVKTSPSAQWSPDECRLRWNLGRIEPGASGLARAVVGAKPNTPADRASVALHDATRARVVFTGWPGQSLSGAGFEVALDTARDNEANEEGKESPDTEKTSSEQQYHNGKMVWFGEMIVKP